MKNFILVILGIIAVLLVVGGATAYTLMNQVSDDSGSIDSSEVLDKFADKLSDAATSEDSQSQSTAVSSYDDSDDSEDEGIVSEEVKFNAQDGEGYYREVTYKDGGFRQYDSESGELIGSSYDSDQDKLPSME